MGRDHPRIDHRRDHPGVGPALDVHVISANEEGDPERIPLPPIRMRLTPLSRRRQMAGGLLALIGLPLLTLILTQLRAELGFTSAAFFYLILVVAVATVGGVWPAMLAALAGFALLNWFFAEPIHTFTIRNERDLVALAAFLFVAGVVSTLVDVAARRSAEANRARSEAEALAGMAGSLLRKGDPIPELLANLVALFRLDHAAVVRTDPELELLAEAGAGAVEDSELIGSRSRRESSSASPAPTSAEPIALCSAPSRPSSRSRSRASGSRPRPPRPRR